MRRDTREMFDPYVSRKPCSWSDVRTVQELSDDELLALRALPKLYVDENFGTFDDHPLLERRDQLAEGCEYLVIRTVDNDSEEVYYVNTEGYTYCRYVFRLDDAWRLVI